jgi:hypothetical protein
LLFVVQDPSLRIDARTGAAAQCVPAFRALMAAWGQ